MKKFIYSFVLSFFTFFTFAEEGMLIPSLIAAFQSDMKAKGMKLTAEQIYSINNSSLKDAIIHFGGGCTAEIISNQGLILTNHHCGYYQIQQHSSLENDYLKNGFWAKNLNEELPNAGLTASRIVSIEDVSIMVLFGTENIANKDEKQRKISENIQQIIKDKTTNSHYTVEIQDFDYGNSYYSMTSEVFQDIRLVGTPPNS
ncbi:MAG: S46 family peptidase, partial [Crocinitomicaceae bacterium]|nr:S46 family peptidase [Crocinitomicaceae bacterium]